MVSHTGTVVICCLGVQAKAMAVAEARSSTVLPTANFGAKYEQHINQMQKLLNDTNQKVEEHNQREEELKYEQDKLNDQLEEVMESIADEEENKNEVQEASFQLQKQIDKMRAELDEISAVSCEPARCADAEVGSSVHDRCSVRNVLGSISAFAVLKKCIQVWAT